MQRQILFSFLFFIGISSFKAQSGSVKGVVKTADHMPANFLAVGIKGTTIGTTLKNNGEFSLENVSPGTQTLIINLPGAKTREEVIAINENSTTFLPEIILTESALQLDEVTVSGVRTMNEQAVNIGKTNIKPMDLPQSVAYIDKEVLQQQQTQTVADALRNFNGVYLMGTTGGVQQEIAGRGFAFTSSNTFKNGVRYNNAALPEMAALERVEVMKGSAAILFGNVAAGGVINLVTKKPTFGQGGEVAMRFDSYDFYKPSVDVYGTLNQKKTSAFRINTVYEKAGSFRKDVKSERIYINPSFAFKLNKKTDLLVEGDFLKDGRTSDFGVGAINYQLIDIPRETFLGAKWSYYNVEQKSGSATIVHRFNNNWQLRSVTAAQYFDNDLFGTARPNSNSRFIRENGNWVRGLQRTTVGEKYYITQLDLTGKFNTGAIKHQLLIGGDADQYETTTVAYNALDKYDSINVYNTTLYKQRNDIPDLLQKTTTTAPIQRAGVYIQDLVSLTDKIKVLAGVRGSYLETTSRVLTHSTGSTVVTKQYDYATTPRLGLVLQPNRKLSLFSSYANSFAPNTGVDIEGKALRPSYMSQYEAGIKSNLFREVLSANITAYQIVNSNLAQTSLVNGNTNTNIKELAGEVTSKGVEVDIMSKSLCGFLIMAGYSYNETRYTKSNTYVVGSLLRYNPNHTANASVYYNFCQGTLKGLSAGISALYFGERQAGRSTRVTVDNDPYKLMTLPAYTLIDLHAGYSWQSLSVKFKISNILNALSYNVHDDNSVNPIAPRQFATTLALKF